MPVTAPSRYGENNCFTWEHFSSDVFLLLVFPVPIMASPRPFYPLQLPVTARVVLNREHLIPARFLLRAHTTPVVAAVLAGRGSAGTSPSPAKSPAPRQFPHTTFLPDRAGSASCDTALELSLTLLPPGPALRDGPRYRRGNRHDRSKPVAGRARRGQAFPIPAGSMDVSFALCLNHHLRRFAASCKAMR